MNHLPLIIKREYLAKVKNKSFLLMTFLSPLIMVGFISLVTYLTTLNNEIIRTISVLDESEFFKETLISTEYTKYHYLDGVDLESAKSLSNQASSYGLLYIPNLPIDSVSEEIKFLDKFDLQTSPSGGAGFAGLIYCLKNSLLDVNDQSRVLIFISEGLSDD